MIGIYKITSPNGRIYIGQSVDIKRRFTTYKGNPNSYKSSVKLHRSFLKHGYANHTFEVIEECDVDNLNERERYWQDFYNATSDDNLNCFLTETPVLKRVGRSLTDKQKERVSQVHKGKKLSAETIEKIKIARAKQVITKEHRDNISKNSGCARLVMHIETGIFYNSAKEAAKAYNMKHNTLVGNLLGRNNKKINLIYV